MPRLPRVTGKKVFAVLRKIGFQSHRQRGSHLTLKHSETNRKVTIPMHAGKTILPKTLKSILNQAGITADEFIRLLHNR